MTIACPRCEQQVRVPEGRRIRVTCPRCQAAWVYPFEPVEHSSLDFRCAITGERFTVSFSRQGSENRFQITDIALFQPPPPDPVKDALNQLAQLSGKALAVQTAPDNHATYDSQSFDFCDFHCPRCHPKGKTRQGFIRCGVCETLVCDAGVTTTWEGQRRFNCYPECGHSGIIAEGSPIASYNAKRGADFARIGYDKSTGRSLVVAAGQSVTMR